MNAIESKSHDRILCERDMKHRYAEMIPQPTVPGELGERKKIPKFAVKAGLSPNSLTTNAQSVQLVRGAQLRWYAIAQNNCKQNAVPKR